MDYLWRRQTPITNVPGSAMTASSCWPNTPLANDPAVPRLFAREFRALKRLRHPNIVTVYERGQIDGRSYLTMEYLPGPSLTEMAGHRQLALPEVLQYATQLAAALDAAHDVGVVHGDIKPSNVLFCSGVYKCQRAFQRQCPG